MARVLVLGASGGIGRHVVDQGLQRGWQVTAGVRRPFSVASHDREGLSVRAVDVYDPVAVGEAVDGHDAVILALGSRTPRVADPVTSTAARHVLPALAGTGSRRLISVSSFGLGDRREYPFWVRWLVIDLLYRRIAAHQYADVSEMEEVVRRSAAEWTLVRPTHLSNRRAVGAYRTTTDGHRAVRWPTISRADVATFLLDQVEDRRFVRQAVHVGNPLR